MKEIIKELSGWLLYIGTDHCSYMDRGYLCGAENRSQWFFYGNYTVR